MVEALSVFIICQVSLVLQWELEANETSLFSHPCEL